MTIDGNTNVNGTLSVRELHTEFVSPSIMFASGSTQFGDTLDDTHIFTGSLQITGSVSLNNYTVDEISNEKMIKEGAPTFFLDIDVSTKYIHLYMAKPPEKR